MGATRRAASRAGTVAPVVAGLVLALCAAGLAVLFALRPSPSAGAAERIDPAPDDPVQFRRVPDFRFVDQRGEPFGTEELRGRPWVLAAVFTTCSGPCPTIVSGLLGIEDRLAEADARIVCLSVDPDYDTSEVLARYADRVGAGERWRFLTGPEEEVHGVLMDGFWMAVERDDSQPRGQHVTHKSTVVAVDGSGAIRGWYSALDEEGLEALAARVQAIAREEPAPAGP